MGISVSPLQSPRRRGVGDKPPVPFALAQEGNKLVSFAFTQEERGEG